MSAADVIAQLIVTLAFMGLGLAGWCALAPAARPRICGACGADLNQRPHYPSCPLAGGRRAAPR